MSTQQRARCDASDLGVCVPSPVQTMESEHDAVCRIISVADFDNFRRAIVTTIVDLPAIDSNAPLDGTKIVWTSNLLSNGSEAFSVTRS
ncbi:hypothetical protein [Paraburkholderia sp. EG304]|uniref:hypothetical protein n=1 Tax=Paraburkholderia sp. EG304 TaxID=3237015 RepID=UPI00397CCBB4